jgi:hypothetical protein
MGALDCKIKLREFKKLTVGIWASSEMLNEANIKLRNTEWGFCCK